MRKSSAALTGLYLLWLQSSWCSPIDTSTLTGSPGGDGLLLNTSAVLKSPVVPALNDYLELQVTVTYEGPELKSEALLLSLLKGVYQLAQRGWTTQLYRSVFRELERPTVPDLLVDGPHVSQTYHAIWALEGSAQRIKRDQIYSCLRFQAIDKGRQQRAYGKVFPQPRPQAVQASNKFPDTDFTMLSESQSPQKNTTAALLNSPSNLDKIDSSQAVPESRSESANATDTAFSNMLPTNFHTFPFDLPSGKVFSSKSALLNLITATATVASRIQESPPPAGEFRDGGVVLQILRNEQVPGLQNGWLKKGFIDMAHRFYDLNEYRDTQMILMLDDKVIGWITMIYNGYSENATSS